MWSKTGNTASGQLFVVAAPSGAGKTSLVNALLADDQHIRLSVSHTTRKPRPGEEHGRHYFFVTDTEFQQAINADQFIEHARVFDHWYGTSQATIAEITAAGLDVILEIDWQGARQIRASHPDCVSIFILPPSLKTLTERLTGRGQDSAEVIQRRMRDAQAEISHFAEFEYLIVNDDFELALKNLKHIVQAARLRRPVQQQKFDKLLEDLLESR